MTAAQMEDMADRKDSAASRSTHEVRRARASQKTAPAVRRFFLAKPGSHGGVPELDKEFRAEAEAMVESLKTGLSYFVISEWRAVAHCSGKKPQVGSEAVTVSPKLAT